VPQHDKVALRLPDSQALGAGIARSDDVQQRFIASEIRCRFCEAPLEKFHLFSVDFGSFLLSVELSEARWKLRKSSQLTELR
jgi:hypothetical protein